MGLICSRNKPYFNALQSTLIVYRGEREVGRIFAEANPTSIETLLRRAL